MNDQVWEYKSSSNPNTVYRAKLRSADGRLSCDCKGWTMLRSTQKFRECKHTKGIYTTLTKIYPQYSWATVGDARHLVIGADEVFNPDTATVEIADEPLEVPNIPNGYYAPMNAASIEKGKSINDYPASEWLMQEKYDGVRVTLRVTDGNVKAWSRPRASAKVGKDRILHPNITKVLSKFPNGYYDGELLVPGGRSTDVVVLENAESLYLTLFDVLEVWVPTYGGGITNPIDLEDPDDGKYVKRYDLLIDIFSEVGLDGNTGYVRRSPATEPNEEDYQAILAAGGEGVMLKRRNGLYRPGYRSPDWVKVKGKFEDVFIIVGFDEGLSGPHSVVLLESVEDSAKTQAKTLDNEWRRRCASGDIKIGMLVEVEHYGHMITGGFRHPMVKRVVGEE